MSLKLNVENKKETIITFDLNVKRAEAIGLDSSKISLYSPWQQLSYFLTGDCAYLQNGSLTFNSVEKGPILFKHEQGSFYTKTPPLTEDEVLEVLQSIDQQMPYLKYCINSFQVIGDKIYSIEPATDWMESNECKEYMEKISTLRSNTPARNIKISQGLERASAESFKQAVWFKIFNPDISSDMLHKLTGIGKNLTFDKVSSVADSMSSIVNGSVIDSKVLMGLINELKEEGIDTEVLENLKEYDSGISKEDLDYSLSDTTKQLIEDLKMRYTLDKDSIEILEMDTHEDRVAAFLDRHLDLLENTEKNIVENIKKQCPGRLSQAEARKYLFLYLYNNPDKIENIKLSSKHTARQTFINRIEKTVDKLNKETDKVKEEKERE